MYHCYCRFTNVTLINFPLPVSLNNERGWNFILAEVLVNLSIMSFMKKQKSVNESHSNRRSFIRSKILTTEEWTSILKLLQNIAGKTVDFYIFRRVGVRPHFAFRYLKCHVTKWLYGLDYCVSRTKPNHHKIIMVVFIRTGRTVAHSAVEMLEVCQFYMNRVNNRLQTIQLTNPLAQLINDFGGRWKAFLYYMIYHTYTHTQSIHFHMSHMAL